MEKNILTKNKISRRQFILGAMATGALVLTGAGCGKNEIAPGKLNITKLRQIVVKNNAAGRMIMWQAQDASEDFRLKWRVKGASAETEIKAQDVSFTDDGKKVQQYAAEVTGLKPGESYEYSVVCGDKASDWQPLTPDTGEEFTALIFPDSQSSDYSDWQKLAKDAAARHKDAKFAVNMGDLVDNGEDSNQWDDWFEGLAGLIEGVPFVPVMGNHETYNLDWKVRLPSAYLNYFSVPQNGSQNFNQYYYSFDYGAAHFAVINTQWGEVEEFLPGLMEEQQAWLREDMRDTDKKWKIVLMHKDVLQYRIKGRPERTEGISDIGEAFMPIFEELGVDLVLTAHLHTYRDRGQILGDKHAKNAPLYILTGVAGNVRYPNLWIDHALDEVVAPQPETDNYLTLKVSKNNLEVAAYLPNGTEIDRREITK